MPAAMELINVSTVQLSVVMIMTFFSVFTVLDASLQEGEALRKMMVKWQVNFPSWTAGGDPCASPVPWEGVDCKDGKVITLNVSNTGITGVVPPEVGLLTSLQVLDVSNCCIDGLDGTRILNLIAANPLASADEIFPPTLVSCNHLRSVNASNFAWNLPFPSVIPEMMDLEEIFLSRADLTGSVPDNFFLLFRLRKVYLDSRGTWPGMAGNLKGFSLLKSLTELSLAGNPFNQEFYEELGTLTNLEYLNCASCGLYGGLPESLGQLQNLKRLTVENNLLTGVIPDSWMNMKDLEILRIDGNFIVGSFPNWLLDFDHLDSINLGKNYFFGPLPYTMTELEQDYNASFRFNVLRWDCNYLEFPSTPCRNATNPCSSRISDRLGTDEDKSFSFTPNCYSDGTQQERDAVKTCSSNGHTLDCVQFMQRVTKEGLCPACPPRQSLKVLGSFLRAPGQRCVCTLTSEQPQLSDSNNSHKGVPIAALVGGILGAALIFLLLLGLVVWKRRKHFHFMGIFLSKRGLPEDWEIPPNVQRFTGEDLAKVTNDFSDDHVIGVGGFGKVYRGDFSDGRMVAIKRAAVDSLQGVYEFRNEIALLSRLHNRHLVKLQGFCDEENFQCLVYEYMVNGNLHSHLLREDAKTPLTWRQRFNIAYGVAQGLEYLHSFANPPVIHRDVKPANILLDENLVAKLADFGISKEHSFSDTHVTTVPAGTAGYLDPDYFLRRQLTTASDVYAYGVVLLELVTGQKAVDHSRHEEFNLVAWVTKRFATSGIVAVVDPLVAEDCPFELFSRMTELALRCASFNTKERPTMKMILNMFEMTTGAESEGGLFTEAEETLPSFYCLSMTRSRSKSIPPCEMPLVDNPKQVEHGSQSNTSRMSTDPDVFGLPSSPTPR